MVKKGLQEKERVPGYRSYGVLQISAEESEETRHWHQVRTEQKYRNRQNSLSLVHITSDRDPDGPVKEYEVDDSYRKDLLLASRPHGKSSLG